MPPYKKWKTIFAFPRKYVIINLSVFIPQRSFSLGGIMIDITMKSKSSMDQNSILSINNTRVQGALCARNIASLNQPPAARHASAPAYSPHARPQNTTAAHSTAVRTPAQATAPISAPPARRLPVFAKPVQKGQKTPLPIGTTGQKNHSPGSLSACFGWNTLNAQCDLDVSAFLLGADGKVIGDSWFVFYGQTESPDRSCRFQTGDAADREIITIDFQKLHADVKKIVFVLTINEAFAKRLHFGMVKDAYIRILDAQRRECVSFQMTEYYSNVISMMIGEIYQYGESWKFNAVGNGVAKDLAGLCALYGVEVSD